MVNISSIANTITNIDGDIHDNAAQIEALNVSCFFLLDQIGNYRYLTFLNRLDGQMCQAMWRTW